MCDSKQDGGRRCPSHSPASRRTGRAAVRLYGSNSATTRAAVESLPSEYVHGTISERARIAATTTDERVKELAARDRKPAVVDALAENPNREEGEEVIKLAPSKGLDLSDIGIDSVDQIFKELGRPQRGPVDNFAPDHDVRNTYGTDSLLLEALGKYKAAPFHALLAWASTGENVSEAEATHRIRSPRLDDAECSGVNKFLLHIPCDPETDPEFLRKLADRKGPQEHIVVITVAGNPSTPVDLLESLAARREHSLSYQQAMIVAIAQNPSTPVALLSKLAVSTDVDTIFADVRAHRAIAKNPSTPADVLEYLVDTKHADFTLENNLSVNPNTPLKALERMARRTDDPEFRTDLNDLIRIRKASA